jgi:ABC-type multidrug transport system fused ATPase/permease subunit
MANDSQRIFDIFSYGDFIFFGPFLIVLVLILLTIEIGFAGAVGVGLLVIMSPIQMSMGKMIGKFRRSMLKVTDERVKFMNEIMQGIRVIKLNAWEGSVVKAISALRFRELAVLCKLNFLKATNTSITFMWPMVATYVVVVVYVSTGKTLEPGTLFLILSFINSLRFPMTMIPMAVNSIAEGAVSLKRLSDFLSLPELDKDMVIHNHLNEENSPWAVKISNGKFSWDTETPILEDINIEIKKGSLIAVIGKVGSGKTSLLSALLNELHCLEGSVSINGGVSYTSQSSWIRNQSIRDNILFGEEFDAEKYNQVIHACALGDDLNMLSGGDLTEIGERGINLSGGQKARVALARAAYLCDSRQIFILDDPLSAVDLSVGKHIFENCILGALRNATRIVVMNSHLHLLQNFDSIIVVGTPDDDTNSTSRILAMDTFENMKPRFPNLFSAAEVSDVEEKDHHFNTDPVRANALNQTKVVNGGSLAGLMKKEDRVEGSVRFGTYLSYFRSVSRRWGPVLLLSVIFFYVLGQLLKTGTDFWVVFWADDAMSQVRSQTFWIASYGIWVAVMSIVAFLRSFQFVTVGLKVSQNLHDSMFGSLLGASIPEFFDVTPIGQIVNRFSRDLDQLDVLLPDSLNQFVSNLLQILGALIVACIGSPFVLIAFVPVFVTFIFMQRYFRRSSREIKRLNAISRTPLLSLFAETLNGLTTIRAFGKVQEFVSMNTKLLDRHVQAFLASVSQFMFVVILTLVLKSTLPTDGCQSDWMF